MNVLLIEDEELSREFTERTLSRAGHHVEAVGSGGEGLVKLAVRPYDAVVVNILSRGGDGLELIGRLREAAPGTPVVAMASATSKIGRTALELAARAGADATLRKPFLPSELIRALDRVRPQEPKQD